MGARPAAALALAALPHGAEALQEEDLFQMLAGASGALAAEGCALAGGHTCEGTELGLGARAFEGGAHGAGRQGLWTGAFRSLRGRVSVGRLHPSRRAPARPPATRRSAGRHTPAVAFLPPYLARAPTRQAFRSRATRRRAPCCARAASGQATCSS
jgi:hypothetical protein